MIQVQTVKVSGAGFLVNGAHHISVIDGNPDYQRVLDWIASGNTPEPEKTVTEYAEDKKVLIGRSLSDALSLGYICTNSIKMDATKEDVATLDEGYRLQQKFSATSMDIRDFDNVTHQGVLLADVDAMIKELGLNYYTKLRQKWARQAEVDAVVANSQLPQTDPNYLTDSAARTAIDAVALVS